LGDSQERSGHTAVGDKNAGRKSRGEKKKELDAWRKKKRAGIGARETFKENQR